MNATLGTASELLDLYRPFFERALSHDRVGPKLASSGLVVEFVYTFPEGEPARITANLRADAPKPAGSHGVCHYGPGAPWAPDVAFTQSAELGNRFWQGQVNVLAALAKREIRATGAITRALGLLPAIRPAYRLYAGLLKERGRLDLLLISPDDDA